MSSLWVAFLDRLEQFPITLVILGLKSSLLLACALSITLIMKRASAGARHVVWCLALTVLIGLPLYSLVALPWTIQILPASFVVPGSANVESNQIYSNASRSEDGMSDLSSLETRSEKEMPIRTAEPVVAGPIRSEEIASEEPRLSWPLLVSIIWISGFLWTIGLRLSGSYAVRRLEASSEPLIEACWVDLLRESANRLQLRRAVRLMRSPKLAVPMTWGIWFPTLVLPTEADGWSEERRRVVILHELAHIRRWDCLTQTMGWIVCALYWFNPLVWFALRRLRIERECACDDVVLQSGEKPSDYARHLLELARSVRNVRMSCLAAVAMAQSTRINDRVRAVLDVRQNRRNAGLMCWAAGIPVAFALLTLIAAVRAETKLPAAKVELAGAERSLSLGVPQKTSNLEKKQTLEIVRKRGKKLLDALPSVMFSRTENWRITNEILKLGPDVLPVLVEEFKAAELLEVERRIIYLQQKAAWVIAEFGPLAEPIVPDLIDIMSIERERTRDFIIMILGEIGPGAKAAVPVLIEALKGGRSGAGHALNQIDPGSSELLATYIEILDQPTVPNRHIRTAAARSLGDYGIGARAAVPLLVKALASDDSNLRWTTVMSLGKIPVREAIEGLKRALTDTDLNVRVSAAEALLVHPENKETAKAVLLSAINDVKGTQSMSVLRALAKLGEEAAAAVPRIAELITGSDEQGWRYEAVDTLVKIGQTAKQATPTLTEALQDPDERVRIHAGMALAALNGETNLAVRVQIDALESGDMRVRGRAAENLADLGSATEPGVQRLREMLDDPENYPRFAAARAIWMLTHRSEEVVPSLIRTLEENIHHGRAVDLLAEIGGGASSSIPILEKCLQSKRCGDQAAAALARIDPEGHGPNNAL